MVDLDIRKNGFITARTLEEALKSCFEQLAKEGLEPMVEEIVNLKSRVKSP